MARNVNPAVKHLLSQHLLERRGDKAVENKLFTETVLIGVGKVLEPRDICGEYS